MLLIDDLLLGPGKFVLWIVRQVHEAAQKELDQEAERITAELGELHRLLESGAIGEDAFDARERELLDRLDQINEDANGGEEPDPDDDAA